MAVYMYQKVRLTRVSAAGTILLLQVSDNQWNYEKSAISLTAFPTQVIDRFNYNRVEWWELDFKRRSFNVPRQLSDDGGIGFLCLCSLHASNNI